MKKATFFSTSKDDPGLSMVISWGEKAPIPEGAKSLSIDMENMSEEETLMVRHVNMVRFDNYDKPKKLILDYDAFAKVFTEKFREIRKGLMDKLDNLQTRALLRGKKDLIEEIEVDKQKLRDVTDPLKTLTFTKPSDFDGILNETLTTDYEAKYSGRILE